MARPTDPTAAPRLGHAETAVAIAECLTEGDVIYAADSETDAIAVARALRVADPRIEVVLIPDSDALLSQDAPASPANIGARNAALVRLRQLSATPDRSPVALITTGDALAYAYPALADIAPDLLTIRTGDAAEAAALVETLAELGYIDDNRVDEPGEVALHGRVLDVFPGQSDKPVRIEIEQRRVVEIRTYDLVDQRTFDEIDSVSIAPLVELPLGDHRDSLLDYLPQARLALTPTADRQRRRMLTLGTEILGEAAVVRRLLPDADWQPRVADRVVIALERAGDPPPRFVESKGPVRAFGRAAKAAIAAGDRLVLLGSGRDLRFLARRAAPVLGREVTPVQSWAEVTGAAPGSLLSLPIPCERGFRRDGVLAVSAADLLGSRAEREDAVGTGLPTMPDAVAIATGDVVVHEDHGIGVVAGIEPLPDMGDGNEPDDAIRLTYAADGVRLVPVSQAYQIWRYGAEPDAVTLDRLDGSGWRKRRLEIEAAVAETARELTRLAEARKDRRAPVLDPDASAYERFAAGFPYAETPDQSRAIEAVRDDMASGRPMDRLIVGDVGFGKTEVALRAAAIAVLEGKQVAVAAPTTVLARQHVEEFTRRFENLGIRVCGLTRLTGSAERKAALAGLADGSIQIAVGTGAVAGKGVAYKDLALVVIDEEQRFGTADKQKLRDLSSGHVLTLTATPIPRTLQTALIGLQQLSVIATPPARRQPIRTSAATFDPETLRAALLRERARRGQSFVVVPRIGDMAGVAAQLSRLVPDLEVLQAHGKLPAADIDEAMIRFARGEGDVLLATNIIEAGLDVPRANTMIVYRADRFGLAQLHQLRGRVGRGNRRGAMLMFTDEGAAIAPRTLRRLQTLEALNRLGAGFEISARDLDLRGAGDILGDIQAGHVKLIGVDLYQQLLANALDELRGQSVARWVPELQLGVQGRLPPEWIADEDTRLGLYIRLARVDDRDAVDVIETELEDRFGDLPEPARRLLAITRLRSDARTAGVARVVGGPNGIAFYPWPGTKLDGAGLGLQDKDDCLVLAEAIEDPEQRLKRAADLVLALAEANAALPEAA
ncbi:helicase-related protein [uncultured Paracoccus sp.]|uniref:helicase-related protein n=1 Tax=uncultured Paracoccus sp. TaxID=189685 RepID=UPI002614BD50|nr:helicase-related protein [uncultured Paracoccus sp.]